MSWWIVLAILLVASYGDSHLTFKNYFVVDSTVIGVSLLLYKICPYFGYNFATTDAVIFAAVTVVPWLLYLGYQNKKKAEEAEQAEEAKKQKKEYLMFE